MDKPGEMLREKRVIGDDAADRLIAAVVADPDLKADLFSCLHKPGWNAGLDELPESLRSWPVIKNSRTMPDWADRRLLAAGSRFFVRHAELIIQLLGLMSLPYCYAAADGARVLSMTGRLIREPEKRLAETAEFIWDVLAPNAFEGEGRGFFAILRTRLAHAWVRTSVNRTGEWNCDWGVPVNQEDMAGTNLSFSLIVVRGLRKLAVNIDYREQEAFLHLWNVIGALLGVDEDLLPHTGKAAYALELAIRERQFKSSEHGQELTKILLDYYSRSVKEPGFGPRETQQLMRFLVGEEVADLLNIPPSSLPLPLLHLLRLRGRVMGVGRSEHVELRYNQKLFTFRRQMQLPAGR